MRAGLSIIQQTLTPESANILNQSIAEACRRTHGQTTPLHVAATLLASPSGFLRQACIRSHPNSSHPLQCRALELCFSVALERLPTAQNMAPGMEPPISNALMAALKRAQAHQRRGCPEQQQQPLLAVKVELDQLIISILDDPSVSRVMREASFSSPAVKAAIEQLLNTSNSHAHPHVGINVNLGGHRMLPNSGQLMQSPNPRFHSGVTVRMGDPKGDEANKALEIMARSRKRNPILVGDSEPATVVKELLSKIELGNDVILKHATVISLEKGIISDKAMMKELGEVIGRRIMSGGVILDLGDLKWLVEQQPPVVAEMSRFLARFRRDDGNKLWLIGTATCETYLRCQVYHSTLENDWDIQAIPVASRSPLPRLGTERLVRNPVKPLTPLRPVPTPPPQNFDPVERTSICPQCRENYEKEAEKLNAIQNSFSQASLPPWLQKAKLITTDDHSQGSLLSKQKTQELQKKWWDTCLHLHQNNRLATPMFTMTGPNLRTHPVFQPKLQTMKPLGEVLQLNTDQSAYSPPQSPVRTDLVLGRKGPESTAEKDFLGCISSDQTKTFDKFSNALDADTYKKLLKGLMEKAWWQGEAASAVASAVTRCRLGNGKCRGDVWLLFTGPDRAGKKKMSMVIAEHVCGASPVIISLGSRRDDEESDTKVRGKMAVDRIAEVVQRNPFSVIMLQDIDEADMLSRGNIKRATETGRITDSHGREVGLGNAIFIVTGNWSTTVNDCQFIDEASGNWHLGLIVREKTSKRRGSWFDDVDVRKSKQRGSGLSLDLNLATWEAEDDRTDGSHNSSDVTIDHDDEFSHANHPFSITSVPHDVLNNVDDSIVFKPVDTVFVRREIKKTISMKFSMIVGDNVSLQVEDDVLEKILGGLLHDQTSLGEWIEKVLEPSFNQLKPRISSGVWRSSLVVLLVVESDSGGQGRSNCRGDWLPSRILV